MKIYSTILALSSLASAEVGVINSESNSNALTALLANSCQGYPGCESLVNQLEMLDGGNMTRSMEAGLSEDDVLNARRLKQLKVLILWLQPEHRFARYCFYGCWCLPDNDHLNAQPLNTAGFGKPVDAIDGSCRRQSHCYQCAQRDHPNHECDASSTNYKYELTFDTNDPDNHWKKSINCLDEGKGLGNDKGQKGGCRRSICECDKKLAEDLREHFEVWKQGHHAEQGDFDWTKNCFKDPSGNGGRKLECCGNYGEGIRMPYHDNGRRKCCGTVTYDSTFNECCDGDRIAAIGAC